MAAVKQGKVILRQGVWAYVKNAEVGREWESEHVSSGDTKSRD